MREQNNEREIERFDGGFRVLHSWAVAVTVLSYSHDKKTVIKFNIKRKFK